MKEEIKFRLGDSVYFPYHGYGTIIVLHNDGREYPIEVRWEASPHRQEVNTFTKDGFDWGGTVQRTHTPFLLDLPDAGRARLETPLSRFP